jgi:hypothetical protein
MTKVTMNVKSKKIAPYINCQYQSTRWLVFAIPAKNQGKNTHHCIKPSSQNPLVHENTRKEPHRLADARISFIPNPNAKSSDPSTIPTHKLSVK